MFRKISRGRAAVTGNYAYAWGLNTNSELGLLHDGMHRSSPTGVVTSEFWSSISSGFTIEYGINDSGELWSWGKGLHGDGTVSDFYLSPVQIGPETNWSSVSAHQTAHGITTGGALFAWGTNTFGSVGNGATLDISSPVQIGLLTNWASISDGGDFVVAVKTDGTLWSWGYNLFGSLGDGTTNDQSSPIQIGALTTWEQVSASPTQGGSVFAIKTDGTLWAWGQNSFGELGIGDLIDRSSPVQVGALTNWLRVSAGGNHTVAIKTDNTLWAWGLNDVGQLGDSTTTDQSSPIQIGALDNWEEVSAGANHTVAFGVDNTVWAWGKNHRGQVGDGTITNRSSPVQVGLLSSWVKVAAHQDSSFALGAHTPAASAGAATSTNAYAWGVSNYRYGDGFSISRSSPVLAAKHPP
jgi:alpha-tubulin suppressor-like RCC1 family protein